MLSPPQNVLKDPVASVTVHVATTCRPPGHTGVGQLPVPTGYYIDSLLDSSTLASTNMEGDVLASYLRYKVTMVYSGKL